MRKEGKLSIRRAELTAMDYNSMAKEGKEPVELINVFSIQITLNCGKKKKNLKIKFLCEPTKFPFHSLGEVFFRLPAKSHK